MVEDPATTPAGDDADSIAQEMLRRWFSNHDRQALGWLLDAVLPFLHTRAHGHIQDQLRAKADTGDLIQEAVIDFLHYTPRFEVGSLQQLRGLLVKIVQGALHDLEKRFSREIRNVARERPLPEGSSVVLRPRRQSDPMPSAEAMAAERDAAIRLAIATLPPIDGQIVLARVYRSLEFAAIGAELGLSEEAARKRCTRAMKRLSEKLAAHARGDFPGFLG